MNIGLFEDAGYRNLLPLTWLRSCCELRCGRDRLVDKVRTHVGPRLTGMWLRGAIRRAVWERFAIEPAARDEDWLLLNTRVLITDTVPPLEPGQAWCQNGHLVAAGVRRQALEQLSPDFFEDAGRVEEWLRGFRKDHPPGHVRLIEYPWHLVLENEAELRRQCRAGGVQEGEVHAGAHLVQPGHIHVSRGARVKPGVVLDADDGPIHIAEDARLEPNAVLQGPCYVGPRSIIRPGAVIRGGTTIGPVCKVGGEIEGSIIHGFTNKQHDGFLGHSYLGAWINLGADTVTSDLKNTYGAIRVSLNGVGVETGQHFLGAIIGDHSKTGIGTILPTGCVIGVAANVFTSGTVPKFVPSFAWLTDAGMMPYRVEKAIHIARTVMGRRDVELSEHERALLETTAAEAREVEAAGWPV